MIVYASHCPLCGQPNQCAREQTGTGSGQVGPLDCWCVAEQFPPELLKQVPVAALGRTCICQCCVRAHQVESAASEICSARLPEPLGLQSRTARDS